MPKPKDFSESAVKLTNPEEVKLLLNFLAEKQMDKKTNLEELEMLEGYKMIAEKINLCDEAIERCQAEIRETVEKFGSYQDLENERYAVQYERKTAVYGNLPSFKQNFPKFVELCVKETLDINALKGQVRGKLITEEELERTKVLTYDTGFAFYVR